MTPENSEKNSESAVMAKMATAAVVEFIGVMNGPGTDGCYFRADDLPEIVSLSALELPGRVKD